MRIAIVVAAIVVFASAAGVLLWLRGEPVREPAPKAERPEPARAIRPPAEPPAPESKPEEVAPPEPELPPEAPETVAEAEPPPVVPETVEEAEPAEAVPPGPPRPPEHQEGADAPAPTQTKEPPPPAATGPASYVGAAACMTCHEAEDHTWKQRRHAAAWKNLPEKYRSPAAKDDLGRACISCHVTGYGQADRKGFADPSRSAHLLGVQCEACHGPGSAHVEAAERAAPAGAKPGAITRKSTNCTSCHNPHVSYAEFK